MNVKSTTKFVSNSGTAGWPNVFVQRTLAGVLIDRPPHAEAIVFKSNSSKTNAPPTEPTWTQFTQAAGIAVDSVNHMVKVGLTLIGRTIRSGVRWITGRRDAILNWWDQRKPEVYANETMKRLFPNMSQNVAGLSVPAIGLVIVAGLSTGGYAAVALGVVQGAPSVAIGLASWGGALCCEAEHLAAARAATGDVVPGILMIGSYFSFLSLRNNTFRAFAASADGLVCLTNGKRVVYAARFTHKILPNVQRQFRDTKENVQKAWHYLVGRHA